MYRVLVVDDSNTCLLVAQACLKRWNYYEARAVTHPLHVVSILDHDQKEEPYDLVLADVHMPVMSGIDLLRHINKYFNIPVVLISADDTAEMVCKGLMNGAPAYLVKPITVDAVRYLWQYSELWKNRERNAYRRFIKASIPRSICSSSCCCTRDKKKAKIKEPVWTPELHTRFVEVMLILGPRESVPKTILEKMNVPWLSREQVASHLQKFRKFLASILDGSTTLQDSTKYWIDSKYYSSIVRGNPNQIYVDQLLEQRRTGKPPEPIKALEPLPPFEEAEDMLIPHNYASSSSNVASDAPVILESSGTVAMPTIQQGGVTSQSGGMNRAMPAYFQSAGNLNLGNVVEGSSTAYNDLLQNLNNKAIQTSHYNQNTVVPQQGNYLANTTLQIGNEQLDHHAITQSPFGANQSEITLGVNEQLANTQFDPNIATSFNANQLGDTSWANQQLGDFQLDPSIGNLFGDPNEFENMAASLQLGGGAQFAEGGWFGNNQTEINNIPPAADNSLLGNINPSLNQNQGVDWDDLWGNLEVGGGAQFADGGWFNNNQTEINNIPPAADHSPLGINPNLNQNQGDEWDDLLRDLEKE